MSSRYAGLTLTVVIGDKPTAKGQTPDRAPISGILAEEVTSLIEQSPDPDGARHRIEDLLSAHPDMFEDPATRTRIVSVAANSRALPATLTAHPELIAGPGRHQSVTLQVMAALVTIAGDDLAGATDMVEATRRYSSAMDEIVSAALARSKEAVAETHPDAADLPFAVIAMGKWGAQELNYYSDIDLLFVHDPEDRNPGDARDAALAIGSRLIRALSSQTFDGPALEVDANLRPEGTQGPLSRTIDSYSRYYREWGEAWELQALIKARHAAGAETLGARFVDLASAVVWDEGLDAGALRSIRRIKERTEQSATKDDIKRARGGIRDIEFTVQLLQLVHGRADPDIRMASTLDAVDALSANGYIDDDDAAQLTGAYRFLRDLEHRIQLWEIRQTHVVPSDPESLDRIGRSLGLPSPGRSTLPERIADVGSSVRDVHERLYFRPILDSLAGSPSARLGPEQAALRLEVLGFNDVGAARRALAELTTGISRRSRLMHQLLPLMLDWLSLAPDPDMGLAQLRTLLAHNRDHTALVSLLQTNPLAGERLCLLLGSGRLLGELIDRIPEFIPRLADDAQIDDVRDFEAARDRLRGLLDSRPELDERIGTIRRFVRRRTLRIAARDVLNDAPTGTTMRSLSDTADASIAGALQAADAPDGFAVVAMGRWGGGELSYESDLDLMYVYAEEEDREEAFQVAGRLNVILSEPNRHGVAYELDAGLRPEGKSGPLARSLDGYRRYYGEWAEAWELLALTRARPVAGDTATAAAFQSQLETVLWQDELPAETTYEIRKIKARVEKERIPPGEDPDYHLKLGRGSLSDIEFLTQLLQLQHGGRCPELRSTRTSEVLDALERLAIISQNDGGALVASYEFCNRVRLRLHLQTGRITDALPTDPAALGRLAASLGYDRAAELRDDYRRRTRRARTVFERYFF